MLTALIVGGIAAVLDTTIVTIALQTLTVDLHAPVRTIQWVSTTYLLSFAVAITFKAGQRPASAAGARGCPR